MDELKKNLEPSVITYNKNCRGCLVCELVCSFRFERMFLLSSSKIKVRRNRDLDYKIKIEYDCDGCGICVRNCMYGALEKVEKERPQ